MPATQSSLPLWRDLALVIVHDVSPYRVDTDKSALVTLSKSLLSDSDIKQKQMPPYINHAGGVATQTCGGQRRVFFLENRHRMIGYLV